MSFKPFTKRVLRHPSIATYPRKPKSSDDSLVIAIKDELLVSQSLVGTVTNLLADHADQSIPSTVLTTIFLGDPPPGGEDVAILQLTLPHGLDIFQVTDYLRSNPQLKGKGRNVTPNHVLIPAGNGDQCPYGAPSQFKGSTPPTLPPAAPPEGGQFQPVIVVDSGYLWFGKPISGWGQNPLFGRGHFTARQAEYYSDNGGVSPVTAWNPFPADVLSANQPGVLDHLTGHANFVAGVIAQRCPAAEITVWNHNGSFVQGDLFSLPTESTVLHSLSSIMQGPAIPHDRPVVINLGFAFGGYTGGLEMLTLAVHAIWGATLQPIFDSGGVVVAPAGNQLGSTIPRYPAALPGVIGVASHDAPVGAAPATPSDFSNIGDWVTCSANGRNVVSTFVHVKMKVEEGGFLQRDFRSNWAVWSGTCFAAPKVAAAIAKRANGVTPAQAWADLKLAHTNQLDQKQELGIIFTEQDLL